MSIEYEPIAPVPTQTMRVALAAFPKGNPYLRASTPSQSLCSHQQTGLQVRLQRGGVVHYLKEV